MDHGLRRYFNIKEFESLGIEDLRREIRGFAVDRMTQASVALLSLPLLLSYATSIDRGKEFAGLLLATNILDYLIDVRRRSKR